MFHFSIQMTVEEKDVNARGHVSFDKYFVFFHETRIAYLASLGYNFDGAPRFGVIAADAHCTYKKELRPGDVITVECGIREIRQKSFIMAFMIFREDQTCAEGYGTFLYFDYENKKVTAFPDRFIADVRSYEGLIE